MMAERENETIARLKAFVKTLTEEPGVYLMKNADGAIIYVGKAKSLKKRVSSYLVGRKDVKTRTLVSKIETIETIVTSTEYEALLLENTLIKQHSPKYNINLKDGKSYPAVKITNEDFPKVFRTRRIQNDGAKYFGPFPSAQTIDRYLELIERLFPLRRCKTLRKRASPCMYWHIGRCSGPCCGKIDKAAYNAHVERVGQLLSGDTKDLLRDLSREMKAAAAEFKYERAAQLRDTIKAIEEFKGETEVVDFDPESRDYIAFSAEGSLVTFVVFQMRNGKLSGRDLFRGRNAAEDIDAIESFIMNYYGKAQLPPPRIYVPLTGNLDLVADYFRKEYGKEVSFLMPDEKRHDAAMAMARHNAREDIVKRLRDTGDIPALEELAKALDLPRLPVSIEGFDIAQLSGKFPVASLITFKNGVPDKNNYRYFRLKSLGGKIDDFESMREASSRRYVRLLNEGKELPDLILIDGGIGQVDAVKGVLDALELDIPVIGLAKREEEIWLPHAKKPIVLPKSSPALHVLQNVRDETHRFATGLNQRLRAKELKLASLESIPGIGERRAKKLITAYGSLDDIARQTEQAVVELIKVPYETAKAVVDKARERTGKSGPA